ncbi:hypothetical protein OAQ84_00815 [Bdellovibrionales bacterium]|nr:hypothetical protein [Bdellovibrionales bacterium]
MNLAPRLQDQIDYWLRTGKVAQGKIISLWKWTPQAISKGKVGRTVEFGRKWIINFEPRIVHLKTRGLGKSRMKSDIGDLISGYRSALSYNLTHLIRDLNQKLLGEIGMQQK